MSAVAQGSPNSQRGPQALPTCPARWPSLLRENCVLGPSHSGLLELEIPPMERGGVVVEELRSVFETLGESIPGEVSEERIRGVGKQEGNTLGPDSSGEGILDTEHDA